MSKLESSKLNLESDEILTDITAEVSEQVRCSKPPLQLENQNTSSIPQVYQTVSDIVVTDGSSLNIRKEPLACCCFCASHEDNHRNTDNTRHSVTRSRCLQNCLSNGMVYVYVIAATALVMLLLLGELLIDLGLLAEPRNVVSGFESATTSQPSSVVPVSLVLHWISFSFLCLFFIEIALRVYAWKLYFVKSLLAVCDAAIVTVALASNLAATIAAGYHTPFDAISLIIVLRFIRIYSLVEYYVKKTKSNLSQQLAKSESCRTELQLANQGLSRQITEKDFEIKQLRAHLGADLSDVDEEVKQAVERSYKQNDTSYDVDLETAIALSKKVYEKENGSSYDNPGYLADADKHLRSRESLPSIVVHHRQNSYRRCDGDQPSTSGLAVDSLSAPDEAHPSPYVSVTMHGQVHASSKSHWEHDDMNALLPSNDNENNNRSWTMEYCVVHDEGSRTEKTFVNEKLNEAQEQSNYNILSQDHSRHLVDDKLEMTSCQSDEGVESMTSKTVETHPKHSRTNTGLSTEASSSDQGCASLSSLCSECDSHGDCHLENVKRRDSLDLKRKHQTTPISHQSPFFEQHPETQDRRHVLKTAETRAAHSKENARS